MKLLVCALVVFVAAEEPKPGPYGGEAHSIPGLIEAEHWDEGKAGVSYSDDEPKNLGEPYRKDTEVDIEKRSDASNGHGIGWTREGEWLNYTVEVTKTGTYTIEMPVASNKKGGVFHIEIKGKDVTGPIDVPDTGGWQVLKMIKKRGVKLEAGEHVLKVVMDSEGPSGSIADIDYFKFVIEEE